MDELIDPAKTFEVLKAIRDDPRTGILSASITTDTVELTLEANTWNHAEAIMEALGATRDDYLLEVTLNTDHVDATHATWRGGGIIPDPDDPRKVETHTVRHEYAGGDDDR